jgi:TPR repeat protein
MDCAVARTRPIAAAALALLLGAAPAAGAITPQELAKMRAFATGLLVNEQYEDAIATFITIAEQTPDDPKSQYDVASAMAFLRMWADVPPHIERAIALDPDNTLYHELAAMTYLRLEDDPQAFAATRRGAELGDIKAMYTLSGMYEHGRGTDPSQARALAWLERAAKAGHMGAMDAMSRVYRDGLYGQAPDRAQEAAWKQELERALAR